MTNKVGSIMARHNNANVEVAGIYNGKLSTNGARPSEVIDDNTVALFRYSSENDGNFGFNEECGNTFELKYPQYISTQLHWIGDAPRNFIRLINSGRVFIYPPSDIDWRSTSYTIDGIFYYPRNTYNRLQRLFEFAYYPVNVNSYGNVAQLQTNNALNATSKKTVNIDNEIFREPFHCAVCHAHGNFKIYLNGVLQLSTTYNLTTNDNNKFLSIGNKDVNTSAVDISCSFIRLSKGLRWTDNFNCDMGKMLYGFMAQNYLPIRHNNQTYYAPLISDANYKSSPCLAARHNNQTYYTVK